MNRRGFLAAVCGTSLLLRDRKMRKAKSMQIVLSPQERTRLLDWLRTTYRHPSSGDRRLVLYGTERSVKWLS